MTRAARDPEGAWYSRTADHYATRGADVFRTGDGWVARCGKRHRGPLSSMDAAMAAAERMLADAAAESAARPPCQEGAAA